MIVIILKFLKHEKENQLSGIITDLTLAPSEITVLAKKTLPYKLRFMMKRLWSHNCKVRPIELKKCVDKNINFFAGEYVQHDSQEFLTKLLDNIHESTRAKGNMNIIFNDEIEQLDNKFRDLELAIAVAKKNNDKSIRINTNTIKNCMDIMNQLYLDNKQAYYQIYSRRAWNDLLKSSYSIINDIFSGLCVTTIVCTECNKFYHKFERFDILTLHLPEIIDEKKISYSLNDLLTFYTQDETIKNENRYFCNYCGEKKEVIRRTSIYNSPPTLIILIKKYQKYNGKIFKSSINIEYDHELDITPYITPDQIKKPSKYELYSVIRHSGGLEGGHYYTYSKNPINNMWYLYDDSDVYGVDESEPLKCNGYVLFYRQY